VLPVAYVQGPAGHGGEMLFGFATAIMAGFLLTAVRNWTGLATPTGAPLAALAALWITGRLLVASPWPMLAAWTVAAFPVAVAIAIAVPLVRSGNRRNLFLVALLVVLAAAAVVLHLANLGVVARPARATLQVGLDVVLLIMAAIGGRVIPMFTANAVPGTTRRPSTLIDKAATAGIAVLLVADVLVAPPVVIAALAATLALIHGVRLLRWQPWRTFRVPLVWILHAGYGWIVVHLALRTMAAVGVVPDALAVHALTIGAIGGLTIGMMTRTARGHTGRVLRADRADVACYALVMAAAMLRVVVPLSWPSAYVETVVAAAVCWVAAFALFSAAYAPSLLRARIDGKPG